MKKIASNLFNEALEMAQMANSSTISYSEAVSVLNETYTEIYQKAINNGSKDFIKELYLNGSGRFELPDDFYQLERCESDYRLENNYIYVSGPTKIRYYPMPTFISFPAEDIKLETKITDVLTGWDNRIVYKTTEDDVEYYNIYNLNTEEVEVRLPTQTYDKDIAIGKDYFAILTESTLDYYDFEGNVIKQTNVESDSEIVINNGNITFDDVKSIEYYDYTFSNNVISYNNEELIEIEDFQNGVFGMFNSHVAFTYFNGRTINTIDLETMEEMPGDFEYDNAIVLKMDNKTGYGAFVVNGNSNYIVSWVPNTILNFPNNVFYSVIIYKLAEQFKIRNGEDVSQFSELVNAKENQFYDMVRKDISRNYVIRDVYAPRRWF